MLASGGGECRGQKLSVQVLSYITVREWMASIRERCGKVIAWGRGGPLRKSKGIKQKKTGNFLKQFSVWNSISTELSSRGLDGVREGWAGSRAQKYERGDESGGENEWPEPHTLGIPSENA